MLFVQEKGAGRRPHARVEKGPLMRALLVPVSSDGVLFVQPGRGICVNPSTTKSA